MLAYVGFMIWVDKIQGTSMFYGKEAQWFFASGRGKYVPQRSTQPRSPPRFELIHSTKEGAIELAVDETCSVASMPLPTHAEGGAPRGGGCLAFYDIVGQRRNFQADALYGGGE